MFRFSLKLLLAFKEIGSNRREDQSLELFQLIALTKRFLFIVSPVNPAPQLRIPRHHGNSVSEGQDLGSLHRGCEFWHIVEFRFTVMWVGVAVESRGVAHLYIDPLAIVLC